MSGSDIFVIILCAIVVLVSIFCVIADNRGNQDGNDNNQEGNK